LIILNDADLELAVNLAAEGSYRNSGQRLHGGQTHPGPGGNCARVHFPTRGKDREYSCGDPLDEQTRVGTVIDEDLGDLPGNGRQRSCHRGS
jgi:aldehyde dehydrogenase (NAD+)